VTMQSSTWTAEIAPKLARSYLSPPAKRHNFANYPITVASVVTVSTQPGHPSLGGHNEYWRWSRSLLWQVLHYSRSFLQDYWHTDVAHQSFWNDALYKFTYLLTWIKVQTRQAEVKMDR